MTDHEIVEALARQHAWPMLVKVMLESGMPHSRMHENGLRVDIKIPEFPSAAGTTCSPYHKFSFSIASHTRLSIVSGLLVSSSPSPKLSAFSKYYLEGDYISGVTVDIKAVFRKLLEVSHTDIYHVMAFKALAKKGL